MPEQKFRKGDRIFVTLPADPPIRFVPFHDAVEIKTRPGATGVLTVESVKTKRRYKVAAKFCSRNPI